MLQQPVMPMQIPPYKNTWEKHLLCQLSRKDKVKSASVKAK